MGQVTKKGGHTIFTLKVQGQIGQGIKSAPVASLGIRRKAGKHKVWGGTPTGRGNTGSGGYPKSRRAEFAAIADAEDL